MSLGFDGSRGLIARFQGSQALCWAQTFQSTSPVCLYMHRLFDCVMAAPAFKKARLEMKPGEQKGHASCPDDSSVDDNMAGRRHDDDDDVIVIFRVRH